jgi:hypothetical protein
MPQKLLQSFLSRNGKFVFYNIFIIHLDHVKVLYAKLFVTEVASCKQSSILTSIQKY